jgi:hypothetical protein
MRHRTIITAVVLMTAIATGAAMEPAKKFTSVEQKIEYMKKNLAVALRSENAGLVEAAMRGVAQLKMNYPSTEVGTLKETLEKISVEHPSGTVRYKAYIASAVCSEPGWYALDAAVTAADPDDFFIAASHRLQQKLLSSTSY